MKSVPHSRQHHDLYAKYHDQDSEIRELLGKCGSKALDDSLPSKPLTQIDYSHFSNTLRVPAYGPDGRGAGPVSYAWEPPTPRAAIGLFWVFTFETDPTDASGFQTQLEWVWQKGNDGITPLGRLDAYLRKNYQDYRGYTVVWSGNKSVHIHLIFDTTHLSREASLHAAMMANTDPDHRLKNWSEDIREDSIWEYHKDTWIKLAGLMKTQAGISAEFDKAMKPLLRVPRDDGHSFHGMMGTDSTRRWAAIPRDRGQV